MTDTIEIPQAFARFAKKISPKQYETEEASVSIPIPVIDGKVTSQSIGDALDEAKAQTYDILGIASTSKATAVAPAATQYGAPFPGGVEPAPQPTPQPQPAQTYTASDNLPPIKYPHNEPHPEWLARMVEAQIAKGVIQRGEELKDQRKYLPFHPFNGDGNARAPWYKGSVTGGGVWPPK